ncbi:tryptophan 7-halogenase [Hyunsoonleella sp. SJ7]|uniref:Tryptophan 7-halogenase n=1 Tax=Hyunsoonleella aquatilis TaxID=2762758 RepID=A0A923H933_9FLAO|nr:NAD(P)/FAD-dependent oxidoreductase [Hyunsoonleella aquatilis]MBC3757182.1 tryptophan 7-halogenase [Hyunsoonleella aquatilis]
MSEIEVDVLVIGAGPSGCVAAGYLEQQGISVKVVEKSKFPRFVIGESLLPRCMEHFEKAGLLGALDDFGFEIKRGARFMKHGVVSNFDFSKKHTPGWDWTWQVPRADFDHVLTKELQNKGVDIAFENEVLNVSFDEEGISATEIKDKNGNHYTVKANYIVDSSGYGRVLPRLLGLDKPSSIPEHSSIFTHVKDVRRPEGREGTLITFDILDTDTWFWVIPFSDGNTSIGFVGKTDFIESYNGDLGAMLRLSEYYRDRFEGVDFSFPPVCIKNFSKSVTQLYGKGYVLTGNSAEFLDPVFSSGVTFATESALKAAKLIAKAQKGENVDWQKEYSDYIMKGVNVFSTYVKEWYTGNLQTLFFHRPENQDVKRQICAVLAGYVWDDSNPFVARHDSIVKNLAHLIRMNENEKANP